MYLYTTTALCTHHGTVHTVSHHSKHLEVIKDYTQHPASYYSTLQLLSEFTML